MPRLPNQFDPEVSHQIERLAARAWPAEETEDVEGWLLRRTEGVDRRRSNSLLPPADPGHAARTVDLALATADELAFPAVVQVSPAESHLLLDETLESRGMTYGGASLVLAGPLQRAADPVRSVPVVMLSRLTSEWGDAWREVSVNEGTRETAELVLSQLGDRAHFAIATGRGGQAPLGVGFGVVEEGWLGLFSLATTPAARRTGIATALVDALANWAAMRGAQRTYLQVEADNSAALAFYGARGFHIAHSYHYRSA